jgi:hypothetical protein
VNVCVLLKDGRATVGSSPCLFRDQYQLYAFAKLNAVG